MLRSSKSRSRHRSPEHFCYAFLILSIAGCSDSASSGTESIATRLEFDTPPDSVEINTCTSLRLRTTTDNQESPTIQPGYTVSLAADRGLFFSDASCEQETITLAIPSGSSSATVYYMSTLPGSESLQAQAEGQSWVSAVHGLDVLTDALRLAFKSPSGEGLASSCQGIAVTLLSGKGTPTVFDRKIPLTFGATYLATGETLGEFHSDESCLNPTNQIDLAAYESEARIYFLTHVPGEYKVNLYFPPETKLDSPKAFDWAARTVLFGTWTGPCTSNGSSSSQKSLEIDDRDFRYRISYFNSSSGDCSASTLTHWTEFNGDYNLGERLTTTNAPIDVIYRSSCLGVATPSKAAEFRSSAMCGITTWSEDRQACTATTDNSNCPNGSWVASGQRLFDIFTVSRDTALGTRAQFSLADLLPNDSNDTEASRPNLPSGLYFTQR